MIPKDIHALTPRTYKYVTFVDIIKSMDLEVKIIMNYRGGPNVSYQFLKVEDLSQL